jgi:hypothetical protein
MSTDPIHGTGDVQSTPVVPHSTQRKQGRKSPFPRKRRRRERGQTPPEPPDAETLKKLVDIEDDDTEHVDFLA